MSKTTSFTKMSSGVDVSIILVNYNGESVISECLSAIFNMETQYRFEVIFVDNASTDDSMQIVRGYEERIQILENSENMGFSYANNQGISLSNAPFIFLLNTDAILGVDTVQCLMDYHEQNPDIGAVVPKLLNEDGSLQCPGGVLGFWRFKQNRIRKMPFISCAAILLRRTVLDRMGGLDENFFFYNEDVDLCLFLRSQKLPMIYNPQTSVVHYGGFSTAYRRRGSFVEGYRGGLYLVLKHYGVCVQILYRLLLFLDLIPRLIILAFRAPFDDVQCDLFWGCLDVIRINVTNDIYLERVKNKVKR